MIKHIVCFKLNDGESPEKAKEVLLSMKGNVPMIKDIEVGVDELHSARSYDVILQVVLEDFETLALYQKNAYHCTVVKEHMHKVSKSSISVDFTL